MYKLLISKQVLKVIKSRSDKERQIIKEKFEHLTIDPFSSPNLDTKKLKTNHDLYRLRIGKYCFIYEIREKQLIILIMTAGSRGNVYKK